VDYLLQTLLDGGTHHNGIFVLATARPDWRPPDVLSSPAESGSEAAHDTRRLATDLDYLQITLEPLSAEASRELALALLQRVEQAPDEIVQMVVDQSEGVPLR
jgi:hypothetical protein